MAKRQYHPLMAASPHRWRSGRAGARFLTEAGGDVAGSHAGWPVQPCAYGAFAARPSVILNRPGFLAICQLALRGSITRASDTCDRTAVTERAQINRGRQRARKSGETVRAACHPEGPERKRSPSTAAWIRRHVHILNVAGRWPRARRTRGRLQRIPGAALVEVGRRIPDRDLLRPAAAACSPERRRVLVLRPAIGPAAPIRRMEWKEWTTPTALCLHADAAAVLVRTASPSRSSNRPSQDSSPLKANA